MCPCYFRTRNSPGKPCSGRVTCAINITMKASDNKPDKRRPRRDEAADAEILSRILDIIGDMPAYGYRRVWAILRRQSRNEGLPFVNAKRVYRIMSENSLLLLHDKPSRPQREHKPTKCFAGCHHRSHQWRITDADQHRALFTRPGSGQK